MSDYDALPQYKKFDSWGEVFSIIGKITAHWVEDTGVRQKKRRFA